MLVDHHAHWLPEAVLERLSRRTEPPQARYEAGRWDFRAASRSRILDREAIDPLARAPRLREAGITGQVLSWSPLWRLDALAPAEAQALARCFNEETAAVVRTHGGLYRGMAAIPLHEPAAACDELRHARSIGLEGAVLPAWALSDPWRADAIAPVFEFARTSRSRLFVHPGTVPVALDARATGRRAPWRRRLGLEPQHEIGAAMLTLCAEGWLDAFPEVEVQFANLGGSYPFALERLGAMTDEPGPLPRRLPARVSVDTASFGPSTIAAARRLLGARAVVLGTDMPILEVSAAVAAWRASTRPRADRGP